jgi:hypothetical protein
VERRQTSPEIGQYAFEGIFINPPYIRILRHLEYSYIIHFDESGLRIGRMRKESKDRSSQERGAVSLILGQPILHRRMSPGRISLFALFDSVVIRHHEVLSIAENEH